MAIVNIIKAKKVSVKQLRACPQTTRKHYLWFPLVGMTVIMILLCLFTSGTAIANNIVMS